MGKALLNVRKATQNNDLTWTVVAASDVAWAKKVFPDLSDTSRSDIPVDVIFISRSENFFSWHISHKFDPITAKAA